MNKIRKSRASKVIASFVGFATAVTMSFGTASAATTEELTAQIASLLATITSLQTQLSTMQGGTTGTTIGGYTFATNLKMGMTSPDVKNLQKVLNMNVATQVAATGAGSPGMESSYFGAKTKAAVIKFQELHMAEILTPVGLTKGTGTVGASTRALLNTMGGTTGGTTGGTVGNTGPVAVMLSTDTPAMGVIVAGQATADLAHFTFTGSGTVNSVVLKRSGISDQNTLSNVYLYDGNTRLTDGYSFNTNGEIVINNLGLAVNGMKVISVKADVSSSASSGQTIAVWLTSFTAGASASMVSLSGNTMSVASGSTLATASFTANTVTGTPTVNAGVTAYTLWSAPLQVNTRTLSLKSIAFRMIGSAPADALSDIKLFIDGVDSGKVATVGMANGANYATFDFMAAPMSLQTGSHTLDVRATIQKGSNRTVQFSLQQAADLALMDPQVGVNVAVSGTIPNSGATITINTGSLTITTDPTFQAMTNVTGGASNVAIAKYKVHAYGEDVKITSLEVRPVLNNSLPTNVAGLSNVTLYFNGSQVGTQQTWTAAQNAASSSLTFTLGSQLIAAAGQDSVLEVRSDVRTAASVNYTAGNLSANLVLGSSNAQGQNSLNTLNTPAITGNILAIQTGQLVVAKNAGYANQSVSPNTAGVKIGSFVLQNQSTSESVRVTTLTVAGLASASTTNLSALRLSETSGSGAIPVQPQTTNTFSVDFTLAPGATKTIDVLADTSSSADILTVTLNVTSIGVTSNVSATSGAVTGQTITLSAGTVATPTILTASATVAQYIAAGNGGAADGAKVTYNFVSTGGAATINELKITALVSAGTPITSVKVGSVSAPVVSGIAYLTGLGLAVPNGGSGLTQDVFLTYGEVGTSGVTPGTTASTSLTYIKYTSGGTTSVINPTTVISPSMTLVGSRPTVSVNTTTVGGLSLAAESKLGEVTVTADAKGNIKINDLKFTVNSSGFTTVPTFTLARIADGNTTIAGTSCGQGVAAAASQIIFCEFGTSGDTMASSTDVTGLEANTDFDGYTVTAGTSKTFSLYATVTAANTGTNLATIASSLNAAGFNWDDTSTNGTSGTNLTGTLIYNFPTGSYTIHQ